MSEPTLWGASTTPQEITLYDDQEEAVEELRANIRAGVMNQVLSAPTGSGKCHGIDTPILMADGTTRMVQDVRVGDRLVGPDGSARTVLSLGRGREEMYRIVPRKGDPYTCNASHILSLRKTGGGDGLILSDGTHVKGDADLVTVPLTVLRESNKTAQHVLKGWRASALEFADARATQLPMPPYVLGAWLGDGTARMAAISKPPCKMTEEWVSYCESMGVGVRVSAYEGRCPTYFATNGPTGGAPNPVLDVLRELDVIQNRHIPHAYKTASVEDRLEVMAGLLDTDGHVDRSGYDWITKDEQLAVDLAFVARSVGLACYITPCVKTIKKTGFVGSYWRCSISGDTERIPCRDKPAQPRRQKKRHLVHGFKIEPLGMGDYYGFEIDGDHLYLLGDFTVCHNTVCATYLIREAYERGKRAVFVADRISLIDQTSAVLDAHGIPHGVIQADHWRTDPSQRVQVASPQTLTRRRWPAADLVIVDEAHTAHQTTHRRIDRRDTVTIGLTATPFARGMGRHYDAVVSVTTTDQLIQEGRLAPFRIFAPSAPDMDGAKVSAGEWTVREASDRAIPIVGDCVREYLDKAAGRKFIIFCADVKHCEAMRDQFMAAGIQVGLYTYRTPDGERRRMLEEFRGADPYLRGLISVSALAKGFDVPDVSCIIIARPLRSSLTEHIQILGRGLRRDPADPDKECIILDHAGNSERFWVPMTEFFANGAGELDDGRPKPKAEKRDKEEPASRTCPACKRIHAAAPYCPACGHEYPPPPERVHEDGELTELGSATEELEGRRAVHAQLLHIARSRGYKDGWAAHKYRRRFGVWPARDLPPPMPPSQDLKRWVRQELVRYAKSQRDR